MDIVIIGSGNVATQSGRSLKKAGHGILQVYNHNVSGAKVLAKKLNCTFTDNVKEINPKADIYLICLKDDAIEAFAKSFAATEKIVLHTSGALPISILNKFPNHGVFYPLQSISKTKNISFATVPLCIEGSNTATIATIHTLAASISKKIYSVTYKQRLGIHTAAVFANNFSNHLFHLAGELLKTENVEPFILENLVTETAEKANKAFAKGLSANSMQTGPAKRGDKKTMQTHLDYLYSYPKNYTEIYRVLSRSIKDAQDEL